MKEINGKILYKGEELRYILNLNVMDAIQEKYGTMAKWAELTDAKEGEVDVNALKFGFMEMLNEQRDIENEENGTDLPMYTMKQVGRILTSVGFREAATSLNDTVIRSTESTQKNA